MANERICTGATGYTIYEHLLDAQARRWNGTAFEVYNAAHWSLYTLALTEQGVSGVYVGDMPACAAGTYTLVAYRQYGASPATSDPIYSTYSLVGWSGTLVVPSVSPGGPPFCTCYCTTLDAAGAVEASQSITFKLQYGPGTAGYAYGTSIVATSDGSGVLTVYLTRGARYVAQRGTGPFVAFTIPDLGTYQLPEILGG